MANITLEAVVYDGKSVEPAEQNSEDPQTELGKKLYSLGFKQAEVYDHLYDTKLVMKHHKHHHIEKGQAALVYNGVVIAIIDGADVDKPAATRGSDIKKVAVTTVKKAAKKAPAKAAAKKAAKKAK